MLLDGLNPPQQEAVAALHGPVLVLAGAGSGKTRVLTHRIANLIAHGVRPWNILSVTFTNKAAAEMKERVARLVGPGAKDVHLSTFHSFCVQVLRRDIEPLGFTGRFTLYDTDDQKSVVKAILRDRNIDEKRFSPAEMLRRIDRAKNRMVSPDVLPDVMEVPPGDPTVDVYRAYMGRLKAQNALDFNDLINFTVELWQKDAAALARAQARYTHLLVDEYQDTNRAQFELVRLLAGQRHNVMVVGDDDQSIYGFRGADISNILSFEQFFPEAKIIRLEQNYRSTGNILAAANGVVQNNRGRRDKTLWTAAGPGDKIRLIVGDDEDQEAEKVCETVAALLRQGVRGADIAVIYRTNAASRAFEKALVRRRIAHVLVGAARFYERREVKDLLAWLRLVLNPGDDQAFLRAVGSVKRGVGDKAVEALQQEAGSRGVPLFEAARRAAFSAGRAAKGLTEVVGVVEGLQGALGRLPPAELVQKAFRDSGIEAALVAEGEEGEARVANVAELLRAVALETSGVDGAPPADGEAATARLQEFLDRAALAGQADELPDAEAAARITLLTAHLAKGLEWPVVFVAGMVQGGFPHFNAGDDEDALEEERRLVYVAFTRARERLYLTRARRRFNPFKRQFEESEPSRFLREIPPGLLEHAGAGGFSPGVPTDVDRAERLRRLGFDPGPARPGGFSAPSHPRVPPVERAPLAAPAPSGTYRTRTPESVDELKEGIRVLHPQFGEGVIQRRSGPPTSLKIEVSFGSAGRKTLFARFAQLEILES